jgi:hypothetical protein
MALIVRDCYWYDKLCGFRSRHHMDGEAKSAFRQAILKSLGRGDVHKFIS